MLFLIKNLENLGRGFDSPRLHHLIPCFSFPINDFSNRDWWRLVASFARVSPKGGIHENYSI